MFSVVCLFVCLFVLSGILVLNWVPPLLHSKNAIYLNKAGLSTLLLKEEILLKK